MTSLASGGDALDRLPVAPAATDPSPPPTPTEWAGPVRPGSSLPVVSPDPADIAWPDARDAAAGVIDIQQFAFRDVSADGRLDWELVMRAPHPPSSTLDPTQRVIEHGLVVDADGDQVADCEIGINNDTPTQGDYRHWVKNLTTGATDERIGPPYGVPFDFRHPGEPWTPPPGWPPDATPPSQVMVFWFLGSSEGGSPSGPCEPFTASVRVYAWASVADEGRVTAWDFAPDAAWLEMPR